MIEGATCCCPRLPGAPALLLARPGSLWVEQLRGLMGNGKKGRGGRRIRRRMLYFGTKQMFKLLRDTLTNSQRMSWLLFFCGHWDLGVHSAIPEKLMGFLPQISQELASWHLWSCYLEPWLQQNRVGKTVSNSVLFLSSLTLHYSLITRPLLYWILRGRGMSQPAAFATTKAVISVAGRRACMLVLSMEKIE